MKPVLFARADLSTPLFVNQAQELHRVLAGMDIIEIAAVMKISDKLATAVKEQIHKWQPNGVVSPAVLTFRGDIYSGLQAQNWSDSERAYATKHLWILSGLYGILRPYDGIQPYRLEMGYPLRIAQHSLYEYWNDSLAPTVSAEELYINLTADEYLRAIKKSLGQATVIAPKFLTISPKTGQPVFVTVHAKIARGAFANWLITHQVQDVGRLREFSDLGYCYDKELSTEVVPVFVCEEFGRIGLSTRLS